MVLKSGLFSLAYKDIVLKLTLSKSDYNDTGEIKKVSLQEEEEELILTVIPALTHRLLCSVHSLCWNRHKECFQHDLCWWAQRNEADVFQTL